MPVFGEQAIKDKIRILLVDDHAVVRSGLAAFMLIFDDLELAGEAGNGQEAVDACAVLQPDVVLMDLIMPVMDGATATREIRARWPGIQVLALTSFKEEELIRAAAGAGAIGYLIKSVSADDLAVAIRAAYHGRPSLSPEAAQVLLRPGNPLRKSGPIDLTAREKEVLQLMARGWNNVEIADQLIVSRSTVKFHVSSILSKLGANTRTEAVSLALQNRLIDGQAR